MMKKRLRRLIALILTFSMCLSLLSATAWAAVLLPQGTHVFFSKSLEP